MRELFGLFPGIPNSDDPFRSFARILTSSEFSSNLHFRQIHHCRQIRLFRSTRTLRLNFAKYVTFVKLATLVVSIFLKFLRSNLNVRRIFVTFVTFAKFASSVKFATVMFCVFFAHSLESQPQSIPCGLFFVTSVILAKFIILLPNSLLPLYRLFGSFPGISISGNSFSLLATILSFGEIPSSPSFSPNSPVSLYLPL